jgi:hypothetical protein
MNRNVPTPEQFFAMLAHLKNENAQLKARLKILDPEFEKTILETKTDINDEKGQIPTTGETLVDESERPSEKRPGITQQRYL